MKAFKHFLLTIREMAGHAFLLPRTIADAVRQRRERSARNGFELERLDRIRNPSKYLGK